MISPRQLLVLFCFLLAGAVWGQTIVPDDIGDKLAYTFVEVGDPQNPDDDTTTPAGSARGKDFENAAVGYVGQAFAMGQSEITNEMYARFLNAVASKDRLYGLYSDRMNPDKPAGGGIRRLGSPQTGYSYVVEAGRGQQPVSFVSGFDAMRFCNWLHNGMPGDPQAVDPTKRAPLTGDQDATSTEDGAYTLLGANSNELIRRNPGAKYFLPDQDEWHKAAYYDPLPGPNYWWFADQSYSGPGGNYNTIEVLSIKYRDLADVKTSALPSHYGTFDQDGNVDEWLDASIALKAEDNRLIAKQTLTGDPLGSFTVTLGYISAAATTENRDLGFRVARPLDNFPVGQATIPIMVEVGEAGNLADEQFAPEQNDPKLGAVSYPFQMGAYEVTNRDYAKFLNAKAREDSFYRLYDTRMGSDSTNGGISRTGTNGNYIYAVKRGMALRPVVYVSIFSAMRYCNWLHNGGREDSDMEAGAYRLLGNLPPDTANLTRNGTARYYLPNASEFYKAAYYDGSGSAGAGATFSYWKFATRSDVFDATNNNSALDNVDFTRLASYFGTYGQSGNVGFSSPATGLAAPRPTAANTGELLEEATNNDDESATRTFRVAAAAGMPSLRPLGDEDSDGLTNGWEVLNDLDPRSAAGANGASGDPDGDSLTNAEEQAAGTDPRDSDTDIDGLTDFEELRNHLTDPRDSDTDNDGLFDGPEVNTHGTDPKDSDTDNDGLSDGAEVNTHGSNPKLPDTDGDGLGDAAEVNDYGTNPASPDTDGDDMRDGWEIQYDFDPKDVTDALLDADGDGLTNLEEFLAGTNPRNADTDGDGLGDKWEVDNGFNPADGTDGALDTDGDGLSNLRELQLGTNPRNPDTDGDGLTDGWEVEHGLNPLANDAGGDADTDGLTNVSEFLLGTKPNDADTDDDRIGDGEEVNETKTNPLLPDTDLDGLTDYQEIYVFSTDPFAATAIPDEPAFVRVGDSGNPDEDSQGEDPENAGVGHVGQDFDMGLTEVTNQMYARFLNAVAKSDYLYGLYSAEMASSPRGGIERVGREGSYVYTVKPGYGTRPVNYVNIFDAMRYCNWLHNGMPTTGVQDASTTEDGAYKLNGTNIGTTVRRAFGAKYFLPDQDEWHKAAYYDPSGPYGASEDYWFFADRSPRGPGGNFDAARNKAAGTSSDSSHYGTFDQDGNVREWLDASIAGADRFVAAGGCEVEEVENQPDIVLITRKPIETVNVLTQLPDIGFRVARPAPGVPSNPDPASRPLMVEVGAPGNAPDAQYATELADEQIGSVSYAFQIGAYEVTNREYAKFLNAKAKEDSFYQLYDTRMESDKERGGIVRSGIRGSYSYAVKPGFAKKPVVYVSIFSAMRYCNWLHNGGRNEADTEVDMETGAYRLLGNIPPNTDNLTRNSAARFYLPNAEEFYKAAFYDSSINARATFNYWKFATRSDSHDDYANSSDLLDVDQPNVPSFFGTYGQSGNVGFQKPNIADVTALLPSTPNYGELLENASNTDDESAAVTFRIAAAAGIPTLHPLADDDNDGLLNGWEVLHGLDPMRSGGGHGPGDDPDGDGLSNAQEQQFKTDPLNSDTDSDGFSDAVEVAQGLDPRNTDMNEATYFARVGHPGNPEDSLQSANAAGHVGEDYDIGKFEVTNHLYAAFLNAVARLGDPNNLYSIRMSEGSGGIQKTVTGGVNSYRARPGAADKPVNFVSYWDALRYINWLHNGRPNSGRQDSNSTENGVYRLPSSQQSIAAVSRAERNPDALYFLPNEDEWHKAAYFDSGSEGIAPQRLPVDSYWLHADQRDTLPGGNFTGALKAVSNVQSCPSNFGTFHQDGNVKEWIESSGGGLSVAKYARGQDATLSLSYPDTPESDARLGNVGFRVGRTVPAPHLPAARRPVMVTVGEPRNAGDRGGAYLGGVDYEYKIGAYEVTNREYAEFLNAVATERDLYGLFDDRMASAGGIIRATTETGGFSYATVAKHEEKPVNFVDLASAMRYCNWLHNGAVDGADTENGAYRMSNALRRNPSARYFLPSENEWYKAAYFDPKARGTNYYWDFAVRSDRPTRNQIAALNKVNGLQNVRVPGLRSYFRTFGQTGNAAEWVETFNEEEGLVMGGGLESIWGPSYDLAIAAQRSVSDASSRTVGIGFRIAAKVSSDSLGTKRQAISFRTLPKVRVGRSNVELKARSSSGLPLQFSSSSPSVAEVSADGTQLVIRGPGLATITATQGGDEVWAPARPVSRVIRVLPAR